MSPIRIVRYHPRALVGDGGLTAAVRGWSEALARQDNEVIVAYDEAFRPPSQHPTRSASGVQWAGVQHVPRGGFKVPLNISQVLKGADLLVLHSGWTMHNIGAAAAARAMGVPYLLEPRGAYDPHIVTRRRALKWAWWIMLERRLVAGARGIHVFFDLERPHLAALGYEGPVVVAPNGVATPEGVAWDGGSGGYVLWMGRFDLEHKGLDLLLEALGVIPPAQRPQLRLHGPDWRGQKKKAVQMVAALGLEGSVTVGPPLRGAEKWRHLQCARGFVYPSRWEGFGISVAEAASVGVPSLVTPYPFGRYLANREAALLAEHSPTSLAAGLLGVASAESSALGRNAARVMHDELQWDTVSRSWLRQVEEIL
jgi:glycosyltransferase involved in cell wall biosynthesis